MAAVLCLSIISLYLVRYSVAQSLVLIPGEHTQPKIKGSGLTIKCSATGLAPGQDPQLTWTSAQGQPITSTNRTSAVYVQGKGTQSLRLIITSVQGEHAGKWICTGDLGGQTQTKDVIFDVWEDIKFKGESYQRPTIYKDALIKCSVTGSPQPEVTWSHNGQLLEKGRYILNTSGLQILNITKKDNGDYYCKAEIPSRGRYEEYLIKVEVVVPPKLTSPPKMTKGIEGKELTMYCVASGDPAPTYKWYKYQVNSYVELNDGGRFKISAVEGTMKINKLQVSDDGTYKCVAQNLAGPVEGTAEVDVLVPPKIIQQDHGEGVADGTVKMLCEATGVPAPEMKWQKVGSSSPYTSEGSVVDTTSSRVTVVQTKQRDKTMLEMQIDRLEPSDIGNYTCMAHNEAGNETKNTPLNVLFKPQFNNNPSNVAYAWSGASKRNITCIVDSNPVALVVWKRGNQVLVSNGTFTINEIRKERQAISNLTVLVDFTNEEFMFGDYVCEGSNNQGKASTTINLRKASLPYPPTTVDVARSTQRWVRLRIGAPVNSGGLPVRGYRIQYSAQQGDPDIKTIEAEIDPERTNDDDARPKTAVDIENLKPSTLYSFKVYARTDVGLSEAKDIQYTTKQITVPDPVLITSKTVSDTSSTYNLVWDKPRDGGSPIKYYIIRYRHVIVNQTNNQIIDVKSDFKVVKHKNPESTSFSLTNLVANRSYQIEIDAVNGMGKSDTRHIVITTRYSAESAGDGDGSSPSLQEEGMSTGAIVGLVIIIFFILLLVVDVTCYFKNRCGIIMCVRENVCGKPAGDSDRQITAEGGDSKETQPLAEKEKPGDEVKGTGAENQADTVEDEKKQPLLDNEDKGNEDVTGTEQTEPDKMEEKEPEDKEEKIEDTKVEECKEAKEEPAATTPEVDAQPSSETTAEPADNP